MPILARARARPMVRTQSLLPLLESEVIRNGRTDPGARGVGVPFRLRHDFPQRPPDDDMLGLRVVAGMNWNEDIRAMIEYNSALSRHSDQHSIMGRVDFAF